MSYQATWTFTDATNPAISYTTTQAVTTSTPATSLPFSTSESFPTPGTFNVQLAIKDPANGLTTTVRSAGLVTILQSLATTTTVTAPGSTYTGKAYSMATASVVGADKSVVGSPGPTYTYYLASDTALKNPLSSPPTDAGSYQVVASFAGNASYAASTSKPAPFAIGQFAPKLTATPVASTPFTASPYAGASGVLAGVNGATIANPVLTYTYFASGSTTALAGAPTHGGNYSVVASYAATTDYSAATSAAASFVITAVAPTVKPPVAPGTTYNGSPYASATTTVTGLNGAVVTTTAVTFTYFVAGSTTALGGAPTDAGNYTVVANFAGNTDYTAGVSATAAPFTITKATPTAKATPLATTPYTAAPYSGSSSIGTGVGGATIANPTVRYTYYSGGTPLSAAPVDAGTYTVVANYVTSTDYFAASSAAASFVITQAGSTVGLSVKNSVYTSAAYTGRRPRSPAWAASRSARRA